MLFCSYAYYLQEKDTGFRGIIVYTFPNRLIPEVLQLFNIQYVNGSIILSQNVFVNDNNIIKSIKNLN